MAAKIKTAELAVGHEILPIVDLKGVWEDIRKIALGDEHGRDVEIIIHTIDDETVWITSPADGTEHDIECVSTAWKGTIKPISWKRKLTGLAWRC